MTSNHFIPYSKQTIDADDIEAVAKSLASPLITTGPLVETFERDLAEYNKVKFSVTFSSGTAALHGTMAALGIGPGDEVIVPAISFVATANCVVFQGARPRIVDVEQDTLLIDPKEVAKNINPRTKAVIAVDYAGQPCEYDKLKAICKDANIALISDSCHALGAKYKGEPIATYCDMTVFSFHPVKHITTGEGGAVVTNHQALVAKMKRFRNHGISKDYRERQQHGTWKYEMIELGYNYRLTDFQCALGSNQLKKLNGWLKKRQEIASYYDEKLKDILGLTPLKKRPHIEHAYHLYVIQFNETIDRDKVYEKMLNRGIGVNVHYYPIHLQPFYMQKFNTLPGENPVAERVSEKILSLPIYPQLTHDDVDRVVKNLKEAISK